MKVNSLSPEGAIQHAWCGIALLYSCMLSCGFPCVSMCVSVCVSMYGSICVSMCIFVCVFPCVFRVFPRLCSLVVWTCPWTGRRPAAHHTNGCVSLVTDHSAKLSRHFRTLLHACSRSIDRHLTDYVTRPPLLVTHQYFHSSTLKFDWSACLSGSTLTDCLWQQQTSGMA